MNKILKLSIIAVLFFCIGTISCTKEDVPKQKINEQTKVETFANLHNQLVDYNKSFGIEPTRKAWWKWLVCIGADVVGGAVGGLIGGGTGAAVGAIAGSSVANELTSNSMNVSANNNISLRRNNLSAIDSLGFLHNDIIIELYQTDSALFQPENEDELLLAIIGKVEEEHPSDFVPVNFLAIKTLVHNIIDALNNADDISTAIGELKILYPVKSDELDIVAILLEGIIDIDDKDELLDYIEGFRDIVMDADISDESKESIRAALAIAIGSKNLWIVETGFETINPE
jgi:outer membrane lipoprotein SlyB